MVCVLPDVGAQGAIAPNLEAVSHGVVLLRVQPLPTLEAVSDEIALFRPNALGM